MGLMPSWYKAIDSKSFLLPIKIREKRLGKKIVRYSDSFLIASQTRRKGMGSPKPERASHWLHILRKL